MSKKDQRDTDTSIASDPEPAVGPGCKDLINLIVALQKGYSDNSIEVKDSPCSSAFRARKKGISLLGCNSSASGSHSSVSVTTSTVNTKVTKVILPSSANEQETSTCGKAKSAKMLQPLFLTKKAIYVDDDSGEEPNAIQHKYKITGADKINHVNG